MPRDKRGDGLNVECTPYIVEVRVPEYPVFWAGVQTFTTLRKTSPIPGEGGMQNNAAAEKPNPGTEYLSGRPSRVLKIDPGDSTNGSNAISIMSPDFGT